MATMATQSNSRGKMVRFAGSDSGHPLILAAKNLTKIYGKKSAQFRALNNVTLGIKRGESVAIVGKSGSGKSTLMHVLALLDQPTSGAIYVNGRNAAKLKPRQTDKIRGREFGFVFQQFFMNANDTVLNNVILPLKIQGVSARARKKRALEVLEQVELSDKAHVRANDLSGGQKQRVCIARALVTNPSVIFADEPTGNLDSATGAKVEEILFRLNRDRNLTLIIVTHDAELAKKCGRQIYIKDGQIVDNLAAKLNNPTKLSNHQEAL
jgi:putative ABC transport system ATP-binding protein